MSARAGMTPEAVVVRYYEALRTGDMAALRMLMAPESYLMTLEAYGLKHTFSDPGFRTVLRRCGEDDAAREKAEAIIGESLRREAAAAALDGFRTEPLGRGRCAVHYTENGAVKKMALSETQTGWRIDYYAGRRRP